MTIYADVNELLLLAARHKVTITKQQVAIPNSITVIYSKDIGFLVSEEEASKIVAAKIAGIVQLKIRISVSIDNVVIN